jgi:hypothetical protein
MSASQDCNRMLVSVQVTGVDGDMLSFDIIVETLRATNLGSLMVGSSVNFERSAAVGDEIGGHNVSGHVCTTGRIEKIEDSENNRRMTFKVCQHTTLWACLMFNQSLPYPLESVLCRPGRNWRIPMVSPVSGNRPTSCSCVIAGSCQVHEVYLT